MKTSLVPASWVPREAAGRHGPKEKDESIQLGRKRGDKMHETLRTDHSAEEDNEHPLECRSD